MGTPRARDRAVSDDVITNSWTHHEHVVVVDRLQEARLEVLKQLLKQREEHHHELNVKRLDRIW